MAQRSPSAPPAQRGRSPNAAADPRRPMPSPTDSQPRRNLSQSSQRSSLSMEDAKGKGKGKVGDKGKGKRSPSASLDEGKGKRSSSGSLEASNFKGKGRSPSPSMTSESSIKGKGENKGKGKAEDRGKGIGISPSPSMTSETSFKGKGEDRGKGKGEDKGKGKRNSIGSSDSIGSTGRGKGKGKGDKSSLGKGDEPRQSPRGPSPIGPSPIGPSPAHSVTSEDYRKGKGKGKRISIASTDSKGSSKGKSKGDKSPKSPRGASPSGPTPLGPSPAPSVTDEDFSKGKGLETKGTGKGKEKGKEGGKRSRSNSPQASPKAANRMPIGSTQASPKAADRMPIGSMVPVESDRSAFREESRNAQPDFLRDPGDFREPFRNAQPDFLRDGNQSPYRATPADVGRDHLRLRDGAMRGNKPGSLNSPTRNQAIMMVGLNYRVTADIRDEKTWVGQQEVGQPTISRGLVGRIVAFDDVTGDAELDFGEPTGIRRVLKQNFSKLQQQASTPVVRALDADDLLFSKNSTPEDDVCSVCLAVPVPSGTRPKSGGGQKLVEIGSRPGIISMVIHDFFQQCKTWGEELFSD